MKRISIALLLTFAAAYADDDPVVKAAKRGTRAAVRETKKGTKETVHAVRTAATTAATKVAGDPRKPSASDIAEAHKKGLVWADHQNWQYHKDGPMYGHTETGEFWTETQAKSAGYKLAGSAK